MVSSPLEQFHLLPVIPMRFSFLDFTLSQSTIMMLIGIFAFISLLRIILLDKGGYIVPNRWQVFVETTYDLCMGLTTDTISGGKGQNIFL